MAESRPPDLLTLHARNAPAKLAAVHDRPGGEVTRWTFAELEDEANRLANALIALGLRRGEKLVWCGQNSLGVVRVVHAARKVGAVAVPLNYRLTPEEAAYVVDHCDATALSQPGPSSLCWPTSVSRVRPQAIRPASSSLPAAAGARPQSER